MGRAIVREPQVFLMDEPLSNLDAKLRVQMRAEISPLQRELGVTTIYVTHDQVEAMTMGDRIAVMRKGVLQQVDAPQDALRPAGQPVRGDVHRLAGDEPRAGPAERARGRLAVVDRRAASGAARACAAARSPGYRGREVALGIRPEHLEDAGAGGDGGGRCAGRCGSSRRSASSGSRTSTSPASPVLTDEVLEVARDVDASAVEALEREAALPRTLVPSSPGSTARREPDRDTLDVAVDPAHLHFFDLETGAAVR